MLPAARSLSAAGRLGGLAARAASTQPSELRRFLVERYDGWTDGSDSLSSSECEPISLRELLRHADDEGKQWWEALSLGYPEQPGSDRLRHEIARGYASVGAAQLNVLAPAEGIYLAMRALLSPGDHVVATAPHYQSLGEVARAIGCEVSLWLPEEGGAARFAPRRLGNLMRGRGGTRLVVANWPHNPTGAVPSAEEMGQVVAMCEASGAHLFVDEMYRGLEHGSTAPLPAACDAYERGITLSGMSKTYGLPGLRIGWLASRDEAFMARVAELKDYTSICPPAPSEVLAFIALRSREALLARNRALVADGLSACRAHVAAHAELLQWHEPAGGTFAFVGLRGWGAQVSAHAYSQLLYALHHLPIHNYSTSSIPRITTIGIVLGTQSVSGVNRRAKLMLLPSSLFECGDDRVRLTFGRKHTPQLLGRWSDDLSQYGLQLH
ncbi:hypothetical protein AB1Y20_017518 [Prymnesium parvum]|uniref:Aminotransferase class I/classII large domain-containing protein n=1 Tax=Prymnesium parvum TaxID=97485 RepID=A0AB34JKR7_PRYPA